MNKFCEYTIIESLYYARNLNIVKVLYMIYLIQHLFSLNRNKKIKNQTQMWHHEFEELIRVHRLNPMGSYHLDTAGHHNCCLQQVSNSFWILKL